MVVEENSEHELSLRNSGVEAGVSISYEPDFQASRLENETSNVIQDVQSIIESVIDEKKPAGQRNFSIRRSPFYQKQVSRLAVSSKSVRISA